MPRRPVSKRLLKVAFTLRAKTETGDGQGGRTFVTNAAGEVIVRGTELAIITEEFVDQLGPEVGDRGVYVTWVDPENGTPAFEDVIVDPNDGQEYEVHRTARQLGLIRLFVLDQVASR